MIESLENENNLHKGVFVISSSDVKEYYDSFRPMILRYDKQTNCEYTEVINFGVSKGMTFERVPIYPNQPLVKLIKNDTLLKSPEKYYVAVTRAKHSVCIVIDNMKESDLFSSTELELKNGNKIRVFKM